MLGYKNHADRSLSAKMAKDVDNVINLIEMLKEKSFLAAKVIVNFSQTYSLYNNNSFCINS
jgi:oligopeptidase A